MMVTPVHAVVCWAFNSMGLNYYFLLNFRLGQWNNDKLNKQQSATSPFPPTRTRNTTDMTLRLQTMEGFNYSVIYINGSLANVYNYKFNVPFSVFIQHQ